MALYNIPPLPSGLHAYFFISWDGTYYYIWSSDSPLPANSTETKLPDYYGVYKTQSTADLKGWQPTTYISQTYNTICGTKIYSTYDQYYMGTSLRYEKTPDATGISIAQGSSMNVMKTTICNLGSGVSVTPSTAFQSVIFESSDPSVCTVDSTGKITAVGTGTCTITIKTNSV